MLTPRLHRACAALVLSLAGAACTPPTGYTARREEEVFLLTPAARTSLYLSLPNPALQRGAPLAVELFFVNRGAVRSRATPPRPGSWAGETDPRYTLVLTDEKGQDVTALVFAPALSAARGRAPHFSIWPDTAKSAYRAPGAVPPPVMVREDAPPGVYQLRVLYRTGAWLDRPRDLASNAVIVTLSTP